MFVHPRTLLRNARAALHQRRLDKLLEADRAANRQQQLVQRRAERLSLALTHGPHPSA